MNIARPLLLAFAAAACLPAVAGPSAEALNQCLADNTSGKDRKDLAKWVFMAMAIHPEIKELSNISTEARDKSNQTVGRLVTRLLSESCVEHTRAVMQNEGPGALQASFEVLGRLAMQELMSNSEVGPALGSFEKYLDRKKLESVLAPR